MNFLTENGEFVKNTCSRTFGPKIVFFFFEDLVTGNRGFVKGSFKKNWRFVEEILFKDLPTKNRGFFNANLFKVLPTENPEFLGENWLTGLRTEN